VAEIVKEKTHFLWLVLLGAVAVLIVWAFARMGTLPFVSSTAATPRDLGTFLDYGRPDIKGVHVNGHFLEIGKRPSMQIVKGYGQVMYQLRPYQQTHLKFRNFTKAEVMDFCTNITADGLEALRTKVAAGRGFTPAWQGSVSGRPVAIVRLTMFSYLVTGLADKPLFMGQVELAKRLGMDDATILSLLIPAQDRWLKGLGASRSMDLPYPLRYLTNARDELVAWLGGTAK